MSDSEFEEEATNGSEFTNGTGGLRRFHAGEARPTRIDQSLVTSSPTIWLNGKRRGNHAVVMQVTQSDAEVTQAGLQINGLRGLIRLGSLAFLCDAKRRSQRPRVDPPSLRYGAARCGVVLEWWRDGMEPGLWTCCQPGRLALRGQGIRRRNAESRNGGVRHKRHSKTILRLSQAPFRPVYFYGCCDVIIDKTSAIGEHREN